MYRYYLFAFGATLSDYLTMADLLTKKEIKRGYVVFSHSAQSASMGIQIHEDKGGEFNPFSLTQYLCIFGDNIDGDELDQTFTLEDGLYTSILNSDLVQTKGMKNEIESISKDLALNLDGCRVIRPKPQS